MSHKQKHEPLRPGALFALLAAIVLAPLALATTIGPDPYGYTSTDELPYSFSSIAGTGTAILDSVDDSVAEVPIGFAFTFYGRTYSNVFVSSNGTLSFGRGFSNFSNVPIDSDDFFPDVPLAAVLWDDWHTDTGSVHYLTAGTPGSQTFTAEWTMVRHFGTPGTNRVTFQCILDEATQSLDFRFEDLSADDGTNGGSATVGLRAPRADCNGRFLQWSFNTPVLHDMQRIVWTKTAPEVIDPIAQTTLVSTGDSVPGLTGATFTALGSPTLDAPASPAFAFRATTPNGAVKGILFDGAPIALQGDDANLAGETFNSFQDAAVVPGFGAAFRASLRGGNSSMNLGLFRNTLFSSGNELVVRKGGEPSDIPDAQFASFSQYALNEDGFLAYTASLVVGPGGVTATDKKGLWVDDFLQARVGTNFDYGAGPKLLRSITALKTASGTAGHSQGFVSIRLPARLSFDDGSLVLFDFGFVEALAVKGGEAPGYGAGSQWSSFNTPTLNNFGELAFAGKVRSNLGTATSANNAAIFVQSQSGFGPAVTRGDAAPGIVGATFSRFGNPVINDQADLAFIAKVAGTGSSTDDDGVWFRRGEDLVQVAREGAEPPGAPGAAWAKFRSIALPDDAGPVFLAFMAEDVGGVTSNTKVGLWATQRNGNVVLLARIGTPFDPLVPAVLITKLDVLRAVAGSPAQGRIVSACPTEVVYRAYLSDGSQKIVSAVIP